MPLAETDDAEVDRSSLYLPGSASLEAVGSGSERS
jgi:hypothetical protein